MGREEAENFYPLVDFYLIIILETVCKYYPPIELVLFSDDDLFSVLGELWVANHVFDGNEWADSNVRRSGNDTTTAAAGVDAILEEEFGPKDG